MELCCWTSGGEPLWLDKTGAAKGYWNVTKEEDSETRKWTEFVEDSR